MYSNIYISFHRVYKYSSSDKLLGVNHNRLHEEEQSCLLPSEPLPSHTDGDRMPVIVSAESFAVMPEGG